MITLKELNPKGYMTSIDQDENLAKLLKAMNVIRSAYGKPMTVTSGLRNLEDQLRINPSAPRSKHLLGAACDIADANGDLKRWLIKHLDLLKEQGLYLEAFESCPSWVHFQCIPPASGNRIFIP